MNEFAPLVIALANMTDKFEEYRIQLIRGFGYENPAAFYVAGLEGLKDKNGNICYG